MLLKTRSRGKRQQKHFPDYLAKIRQCQCLICGHPAEAAHLRMSSAAHGKVNGRDDRWVNPLCPGHHRLSPDAQHNGSEFEFWQRHKVDALQTAKLLWEARDSLEKMQNIASNPPKIFITGIDTRYTGTTGDKPTSGY